MNNRPAQPKVPSVQGHGLTAQQHISTSDIPNLGVDVRFDSLKKYLDEISGALNQHAFKINEVERDMTTKVETNVLAETISMISDGWGIFDTELAKISKQLMGNGKFENTISMLENSQNKLINKEVQQSHSLTYIYQKLKKLDPTLTELQDKVKVKVDAQLWKEKKKKHKRLFAGELAELKVYMECRFKEFNKRVTDQVNAATEKGEDSAKKTTWKLNEVEAQMRHKINAQYVDDAGRAVEERIRREFAQHFVDSDKQILMYEELKQQSKYIEEQIMEKVRSNKKQISDLEEVVDKKYLPRVVFEEKSKLTNDKLYELQQRMKEIDKRSDLGPLIERQGQKSKHLEDKLYALDQELQRKFAEIMLQQQQDEYKKQQEENLHKLCTLEGLMANMQSDLNKSKSSLLDVQSDLIHRMEQIEADLRNGPLGLQKSTKTGEKQTLNIEDLATKRETDIQLEAIKSELKQKLQDAVDAVYRDMKKMNEDERSMKILTQINELQRRHETLESRVAKNNREMDMPTLIKQLREKAENDSVRRDFAVQDTKMVQVGDALAQMRTAVDNIGKLYARLVASIRDGTLTTSEEQLVIMSKRLLPANCISCHQLPGRLSDKQKTIATALKTAARNEGYIMGTDNKPYKVDVKYLAQQQAQLSDFQPQQSQVVYQQQQNNLLSSIASDQDVMSLGGGTGFLYLDKSQNSALIPTIMKKGGRPSTAKLYKTDQLLKRNRPESAKEG